jgi:hypothetical protein
MRQAQAETGRAETGNNSETARAEAAARAQDDDLAR